MTLPALLTDNHRKELLSMAYVTSVASKAGMGINYGDIHDYGVDGNVHTYRSYRKKLAKSGIAIEFQLKASSNEWARIGEHVKYNLKVDAYNNIALRNAEKRKHPHSYGCPLILIILCLPPNENDWFDQDESRLMLKECCYYWYHTNTTTENKTKITIEIPRTQLLTPESLRLLVDASQKGAIF